MLRRWTGVVILALATFVPSVPATASPRFTKPVVAIPVPPGIGARGEGTGGEPRILVARDGSIVLAAHFQPRDCRTGQASAQAASTCVWVSNDARHFRLAGGDVDGEMGDDVDLAQTTRGTLLESAMTNIGLGSGIPGTTVSRSTDRGRTWTETVDANSAIANDRPFMLATSRGDVLLTYDAVPGGLQGVISTDDGATFGFPFPIVMPPSGGVVADVNAGPVEDHVRHELVVPYGFSQDPSCTAGVNGCFNQIAVARSSLDASQWTQEPVATLPPGTGMTAVVGSAADAAGREYISYGAAAGGSVSTIADRDAHAWLVTSPRAGIWNRPRRVDPPGGSAMLPWVVATGNGNVVVAYYGSPYPDAQGTARPWYLYVARSNDAGRTFRATRVSSVAYTGTGADHQSVLWDLIALALDRNGLAHVAWTSVVNGATEIQYAHEIR